MNIVYILIINVIIKCKQIKYNHTNKDNNLFFVFTTFRHGARTLLNNIDYFGNYIISPGSLSKYGCIQHLKIGKNYRKRYSNFLNMKFDYNQIYIRTSDIERTITSTEKQLEGFFNKVINRKYFHIIKEGMNYFNMFHLNNNEHELMEKYIKFCKIRKLTEDYYQTFKTEIFPILQNFYGKSKYPKLEDFCDSVYTAYSEYIYNNDSNNKIGKCGIKNSKKMYNFCYNWYNTFRGWDEYSAYMFYMFYQHIFEYMNMSINGKNSIKMIMIGGHDITIYKFMDFLDGLKIIPRINYPHYAFNIVFELRKYNSNFYLEIYYNDVLRYNGTYKSFKNILNNSKYKYLYNYCGMPQNYNLRFLIKNFFKKKTGFFHFFIIFSIIISIFIIVIINKYLRKIN